ncbi:MAG: TrkH family potassium uptake protein [Paracoccaceae bacterium]
MIADAREKPVAGPATGSVLVAERARATVVLRLVGMNAPALALFGLVPALVALAEGAWMVALALAPGVGAALLLWVVARLTRCDEPRPIEGLVSVALSFLLACLAIAPGFHALGMSPVDALFEAVSGVTTTGLSLAKGPADWPLAGHVLRAWSQWLGGFAFIAVALALVIGRGTIARQIGSAEGLAEERASSTRLRAARLLAAYVVFTLMAVAALVPLACDPVEGLLVALAAVSTGGFSPRADSLAGESVWFQSATAVAIFLGALSLARLWSVRSGLGPLVRDGEVRVFALFILFTLAAVLMIEWPRDLVAPRDVAFAVVSAHTTAGFSTGPTSDLAPASLIVLAAAMAVGGCLGSTAGGLKVFRFAFLLSAARLALLRTRIPESAQSYLRVFGRKTAGGEGTNVMGLVVLYIASLVAVWLLLVVAGVAPMASFFASVSALSGVGLSAGGIAASLPDVAKAGLCVAMLLGRLEFLALIALAAPGTWLRRG